MVVNVGNTQSGSKKYGLPNQLIVPLSSETPKIDDEINANPKESMAAITFEAPDIEMAFKQDTY